VLRNHGRNFDAAESPCDESDQGHGSRSHALGTPDEFYKARHRRAEGRNRKGSQTVRRSEAAEKTKGKPPSRDERDKQPETLDIKVEFMCVCDHAFRDSYNRPCLVGIIDTLWLPQFPTHRALLTIAVLLRAKPNQDVGLRFQFGGTLADIMRESKPFLVPVPPSGLVFVLFAMPMLRFDEPGEYVARVFDAKQKNYMMATRYIQVTDKPPNNVLP
jgi:hypothetical protein